MKTRTHWMKPSPRALPKVFLGALAVIVVGLGPVIASPIIPGISSIANASDDSARMAASTDASYALFVSGIT